MNILYFIEVCFINLIIMLFIVFILLLLNKIKKIIIKKILSEYYQYTEETIKKEFNL